MISENDFPINVQEIFQLMKDGPLLQTTDRISEERILDIHKAMYMQQDEDIKKPYRFIIDITEDASGEIESPPFDEKRKKLIELIGNTNYFDHLREYFSKHAISEILDPQEITDISEAIYEDLILCAKARLMMPNSHPYFEKMLDVYIRQGFPCAWIGGKNWKKGDFVVYSREVLV
ncbi:hypothetical protein [Delftia sp. WSY_14]|uniref:hypothetical protein n=1 Tax=unclassified Delftia TaxID=2613839 RepID=UPI00370A9F3D